jgi:hypothetical protein
VSRDFVIDSSRKGEEMGGKWGENEKYAKC